MRTRIDEPIIDWYVIAACALLAFAAVIRFRGLDASLFEDEVWVAELIKRGGLHPHSYSTPPLFYAMERAWTAAFGTADATMRALPALFGVVLACLPFAAPLPRVTRFVWSVLFAFSSPLLFYSTRLKQYTIEASADTLLIILLLRAKERDSNRDWQLFFVVSAVAVAVLHSPVLIVAAAVLTMRGRKVFAGLAVLAVFAAAYFGFMSPGPESTRLHGDMNEFFAAHGRWVASPGDWLRNTREWVGQALNLVRLGLAAAAAALVWLAARRQWTIVTLAVVPPLAAAALSVVHAYPYGEVRLMIFCFPALYLAVAAALAAFASRVSPALLLLIPFALHSDRYNATYMRVFDLHPLYNAIAARHTLHEPIVADPSLAAPLLYHHPELAPDVVAAAGPPPARGWSIQLHADTGRATTVIRLGGVTAARFGE
jgi:hypothetical protein